MLADLLLARPVMQIAEVQHLKYRSGQVRGPGVGTVGEQDQYMLVGRKNPGAAQRIGYKKGIRLSFFVKTAGKR